MAEINVAFYFPHDIGASNDPKLVSLRRKFGWSGVGMYWAIIEALHKEKDGTLPTFLVTDMIFDFFTQEVGDVEPYQEQAKQYEDCLYANALLLHKGRGKKTFTTSSRVVKNVLLRQNRSDKARIGADIRWGKDNHKPLEYKKKSLCERNAEPNANAMRTECERNAMKGKERKGNIYIVHFNTLWEQFPNKVGRNKAEMHFLASVTKDQDLLDIDIALKNYLSSRRVAEGFVQNGSTWFNNWQDWINYIEPKKEVDEGQWGKKL